MSTLQALQEMTGDEGRHRDISLIRRSMEQMGIDYTILFPTPMLNLGLHPQPEVEAALARVSPPVHLTPATGDVDLLRAGFHDDLHVPYRLPLIPAVTLATSLIAAAACWAMTIGWRGYVGTTEVPNCIREVFCPASAMTVRASGTAVVRE